MQAEVRNDDSLLLAEIAARVHDAADERAARHAFRRAFNQLRSQLSLYPTGSRPSAVFESAATTARSLSATCLPLAIAVAMHLYPLCVLQCIPIPLLSVARLKRALLLRTIRNRALLLANTGSERTHSATIPLIATRAADGVRIDGRCEYLSLSSVADIVLFKAQLAGSNHAVLCAADLRASTVRIGQWKFSGPMELSDTSSVTFAGHRVADGHYLIVPDYAGMGCIADYQRSWFHLFIGEIYLARLEHLHSAWQIPLTAEHAGSRSEVSRLRQQSLQLLDNYSTGEDVAPLIRTSAALKLRVSMMSQTTAAELRSRGLAAEAGGLGYIKSQPTADQKILRDFGLSIARASSHPSPAVSSPPRRRQASELPAAGPTGASCA